MYVQKFEGETLDEALKQVKSQLGPDAIILKTVTNKGLKGAFKKSKIEITAAISESSYTKKAKVDHVLSDDQREQFYQAPSSNINQMINDYNDHTPGAQSRAGGYGSLGLNKVVNTVSKASNKIKNSLDDFLVQEDSPAMKQSAQSTSGSRPSFDEFTSAAHVEETPDAQPATPAYAAPAPTRANNEVNEKLKLQLDTQRNQIAALEQKIFELSQQSVETKNQQSAFGLSQLKVNLQSLDISQNIIANIIKKAQFELNDEELESEETVFEFALRELNQLINTAMPMFSTIQDDESPVITTLISEASSGQTSMAFKLAAMMDDAIIIRYRKQSVEGIQHDFAKAIFKINVVEVETISHLLTEIRKAVHDKKKVILDLKMNNLIEDDSKKVIDALKRSWKNCEVLGVFSAIHSEQYNRKIISKYHAHLNGAIITHVDQCLNYGAILNVHEKYNKIPLKFFGTGATIPDDMEAASSERLLAGMFNL